MNLKPLFATHVDPYLPGACSRRQVLTRAGAGFGMLGLRSLLAAESPATLDKIPRSAASNNPLAPRPAHFPPRAKRVIFLFMNGGPSHVDTFDYKPALKEQEGTSGIVSPFIPACR